MAPVSLVSVDTLTELASLVAAPHHAHDRITDLPQEGDDARRRPRQLPMRFDRDADVAVGAMPADRKHEVVKVLADLLLAAVLGDGISQERHRFADFSVATSVCLRQRVGVPYDETLDDCPGAWQ